MNVNTPLSRPRFDRDSESSKGTTTMKTSTMIALAAAAALVSVGCAPQPAPVAEAPPAPELSTDVLTADEQQAMTPEQVLADLKAGNERFVAGKLTARDYIAQAEATASGQVPQGHHPGLRGLPRAAGDRL